MAISIAALEHDGMGGQVVDYPATHGDSLEAHATVSGPSDASLYAALADRLVAAVETVRGRLPEPDLATAVDLWDFGLRQLDVASARARTAFRPIQAAMARTQFGSIDDPALADAYLVLREAEVAEQYHELALVALSQNLWEAVARLYLSFPDGLPARVAEKRHDPWWPAFLVALEQTAIEPALQQLLALARTVDVTLVPARDRFVAHSLPGHLAVRSRNPDGTVAMTGRIAWWSSDHRADAYQKLLAINSMLPAVHRSHETNQYELARALTQRGAFMTTALRRQYQLVTRDLGFELDLSLAAAAMVGLVEAFVTWSQVTRAGDHASGRAGQS